MPRKALRNLAGHGRGTGKPEVRDRNQKLGGAGQGGGLMEPVVILAAERAVEQGRDFAVVGDAIGQRLRALLAKARLWRRIWYAEQRANPLIEPMHDIPDKFFVA